MKPSNTKRIIALTIFSIAMGMLEAAVVIYLRKLLYSSGFDFPIIPIEDSVIAFTEIAREAATIIMLLGIGYIYGRNFITRFGAFLFSFAIWDIFYYIFLKAFLNWPESIFTWDVLFLIPVTWTSPVIAPVIVSLTMILYFIVFIKADQISQKANIRLQEWIIIIFGATTILISFTLDTTLFFIEKNALSSLFNINSDQLFVLMKDYIPKRFNWWIFCIGELFLLYGISKYWLRIKRKYTTIKD